MAADFNMVFGTCSGKNYSAHTVKLTSTGGFKGSVFLEYSAVPTSGNPPTITGPDSVYLDEDECDEANVSVNAGGGAGTLYVQGSTSSITHTISTSYS